MCSFFVFNFRCMQKNPSPWDTVWEWTWWSHLCSQVDLLSFEALNGRWWERRTCESRHCARNRSATTLHPATHTHILFSLFFIKQKKKNHLGWSFCFLFVFFSISYVFICVRYFITCHLIALLILLCACIVCNKCCYMYVYTPLLRS